MPKSAQSLRYGKLPPRVSGARIIFPRSFETRSVESSGIESVSMSERAPERREPRRGVAVMSGSQKSRGAVNVPT